jgi:hypothetical protein
MWVPLGEPQRQRPDVPLLWFVVSIAMLSRPSLARGLSLTRLLWVHMPTKIGVGGPTWSLVAYLTRWWTASLRAGH